MRARIASARPAATTMIQPDWSRDCGFPEMQFTGRRIPHPVTMKRLLPAAFLLGLSSLSTPAQGTATAAKDIKLPEGFAIELLYSVPRDVQGSWVAMCLDDRNRFIVSDQYGSLYRFPRAGRGQAPRPRHDREDRPRDRARAGALLRLRQPLRGGQLEEQQDRLGSLPPARHRQGRHLRQDRHDQEARRHRRRARPARHHAHARRQEPDRGDGQPDPASKGLYPLPRARNSGARINFFRASRALHEGSGGPGRPHCADRSRTGRTWEILATGFRNQYDAAFNLDGELFTYDADMEWDLNTPWYRPTRINHVIDGAEFGWRTGSAKFPEHYSRHLRGGGRHRAGIARPGCASATARNSRRKYQRAFFMPATGRTENSMPCTSTRRDPPTPASFEEFASAAPLPLTDILVNPNDGAMYFAVGGRRVQSGLLPGHLRGQREHPRR